MSWRSCILNRERIPICPTLIEVPSPVWKTKHANTKEAIRYYKTGFDPWVELNNGYINFVGSFVPI